jgi:hypothetical protein
MSGEEMDAILGKTLRERKIVAERLAYLRVQARHIGERLELLARHLSSNIQLIQFKDANSTVQFRELPTPDPATNAGDPFTLAELDPNNIAALVREFNETTEKYRKLEIDAKALGF